MLSHLENFINSGLYKNTKSFVTNNDYRIVTGVSLLTLYFIFYIISFFFKLPVIIVLVGLCYLYFKLNDNTEFMDNDDNDNDNDKNNDDKNNK